MRTLSKHISCGRAVLCEDTLLALRELREQISLNIPRLISGKMSDHVHIYVDASYDPEGYSGVGGVLYDSSGQTCFFFSEKLSCDFLSSIKKAEQKNMIQELEMLALLIAAELWLRVAEGKTCCCLFRQRSCPWELPEVMVAKRCEQPAAQENLFFRREVLLPDLVRKGSEPIQPV